MRVDGLEGALVAGAGEPHAEDEGGAGGDVAVGLVDGLVVGAGGVRVRRPLQAEVDDGVGHVGEDPLEAGHDAAPHDEAAGYRPEHEEVCQEREKKEQNLSIKS